VKRHIYQSSAGGKVYVPLESRCRILAENTPRCAKMLSWKYAQMSGAAVKQDLRQNHAVRMGIKHIQSTFDAVGEVMKEKEAEWGYAPAALQEEVACISISCDGTTAPLRQGGFREVMVGSISFYNSAGDRLSGIYTACAPEAQKSTFAAIFAQEIAEIKQRYAHVPYIGLADGASWNWAFLEPLTDIQRLDFYHATAYLAGAAKCMFRQGARRQAWLDQACHRLKHEPGGAAKILAELEASPKNGQENMCKAITYFTNQLARMDYPSALSENSPIGSGVVEAACKVLVNQRLCNSGMKWHEDSMDKILMARCLIFSEDRWGQFWNKVDRYGYYATS